MLYVIKFTFKSMDKNYTFQCIKWSIITAMTVKYGIYFYCIFQQGGISPCCGAESGGGGRTDTPTPPPPLAGTLYPQFIFCRTQGIWGIIMKSFATAVSYRPLSNFKVKKLCATSSIYIVRLPFRWTAAQNLKQLKLIMDIYHIYSYKCLRNGHFKVVF